MLPDSPDPFYYLANFERALASLDARCADLFDEAERRFVQGFGALPRASRALFVRMLMRKGPHFRASKLDYAEIGCPRAAAAPLVAAGWLEAAPVLALDALAALVTKAELQTLAARLAACTQPNGAAARATRAETLETLQAAAPEARGWSAWFPGSADTVFHLVAAPLCERLRLMFFGNLRQDWSEFVLADLGVYRYEPVPLDSASRAFQQRADIDAYLTLRDCRESFDLAADAASAVTALGVALDTLDAIAPRTRHNDWLRSRYDRVRHAAGQAAERLGEPALAWRAYAHCGHPESRYRCVRVLEQLDRRDEALALAQAIAGAPANEEEAQRATRTLARLQRRRATAQTQTTPDTPGFASTELTLPEACAGLRVEEAARRTLECADAPVFYVENTLINSLFGLLCWPALFAPLPGAFFHPFQRGPADLHASDFVSRRAGLFAACLAEFETGTYRATIEQRFTQKYGIQSPYVAWPALDAALLALALDCFPAADLKLWFERLLREPGANRSGLPDLVRFWPRERRYELIEVKGPGDRLQDNQRRWLAYCAAHGLPVTVLQVRWAAPESTPAAPTP
ncbi:VRR-NUC domain-containing protein [Paraburkholderia silviterrae]|uniref:phosphodiesterase I n=1 Tax=Paraburkholderia silviterrae TaxID=2528715 RepID=A0A4R5MAQ1_9BURK|nr:VRR-NUC domain-containing protein [Paraburkholderia silviterrae]TDG23741.1 VRR-NUC domain-containing protein [Paraburkholderia silviterrae]